MMSAEKVAELASLLKVSKEAEERYLSFLDIVGYTPAARAEDRAKFLEGEAKLAFARYAKVLLAAEV